LVALWQSFWIRLESGSFELIVREHPNVAARAYNPTTTFL